MKALVVGHAGFVGSHLAERLRSDGWIVTGFDLQTGQDARDINQLIRQMEGVGVVFHLAAHADISQSAASPTIDLTDGTVITSNVLEAMRSTGVNRIAYASTSAVYGDVGSTLTDENFGPLKPTSTYAASKIACEALLSAYATVFGISAIAFRFANVVGPRQPRGVAYDFVNRLRDNPDHLTIKGDGRQSKSYVHVTDLVDGIITALAKDDSPYSVYNIATGDYLTAAEIADIVCEVLDLKPIIDCAGGRSGWPGDVPVCRIDPSKLRSLGWTNRYGSREAVVNAVESM